ncbi:MAG: hypothetical protein IKP00_04575, partial [Victivallales bacterium]|nr:hypothetical protein [Victivallales bacterium]
FPIVSGNLTLYFAFALRCSISKELSPFRGDRVILYTRFSLLQIDLLFFFEKKEIFKGLEGREGQERRGGREGKTDLQWT